MAETLTIRTASSTEVIKIVEAGPQGPAGPAGTGLETLTTQGDMLYRGASTGERLGIGTAGQVLKVNSGATAPEWGAASAVDLTAPGPIGSVTPNTGAFTTLSATGTATLPHIHGSIAGNLYIHVKNVSGGELARGTPVYIVGNVGATDRVEVGAADFDDPTKMPAVGLLEQTLANNGSGDAIILGELDEANTNAYTINQELFVGNNGALAATRPTTGQVQSAGVVARVNSNTGVIVVNMQGQRSPNETFAAATHTHGNLTNDGKIGTTANLPLKTGTNGVVEAGSFGTAAASFCEGNDARLSDDRDPNAHAASHAAGGADALAPSDIGAQSLPTRQSLTITGNTTLTAGRNKIYEISATSGTPYDLTLPSSNTAGDVVVLEYGFILSNSVVTIKTANGNTIFLFTNLRRGGLVIFNSAGTDNGWLATPVSTHQQDLSDAGQVTGLLRLENGGLAANISAYNGLVKIASGSTSAVTVTSAGEALLDDADAAAQRTTLGLGTAAVEATTAFAASGSITTSGLTQATARILGRTTASTGAVEEITIGSGLSLSAGELSSTVSAGIPATLLDAKGDLIVASAADTAARLAVGGTNGHVLTVDSSETLGVKWAAAAAPDLASPPAIGNTTAAAGTFTTLTANDKILLPNTANDVRLVGAIGAYTESELQVRRETTGGLASLGAGFFWLGAPAAGTPANAQVWCNGNSGGIAVGANLYIGFHGSNGVTNLNNPDTRFHRDGGAGLIAQRNGSNAQTFRVYNTHTSATNFERLNLRWASNEFILDAEAGSAGGTLRGIKIGSATSSLLGFYGVTPVDQPATVADPSGVTTDEDVEARTAINAIIDRLQELGLIA